MLRAKMPFKTKLDFRGFKTLTMSCNFFRSRRSNPGSREHVGFVCHEDDSEGHNRRFEPTRIHSETRESRRSKSEMGQSCLCQVRIKQKALFQLSFEFFCSIIS